MGKACAHLAVFPAKPDMNESTLTLFIPDERAIHPIDEVARFTHVPRHTIAIYCRWGLIAPAGDPDINGWFFNDDAIRTLRRIEYLRQERGVNLAGIRLVFELLAEVERLREEVRFLRER